MIDRMTEKTIRLLLEQKEPITTSVIANEIGVSRSSIKHNLDYVKKTLQKAGVLLNSIPGKGVDVYKRQIRYHTRRIRKRADEFIKRTQGKKKQQYHRLND